MVLNTITVGAAVTPTVVKTYASHYANRKPRRQRPTAHISYDEGLNLIRQFLVHASHHTVEDIQAFTSQWVPNPRWVRTEDIVISEEKRKEAANAIVEQLGHKGVDQIGGKMWWQWRRDDKPLKAEWIEMRAEYSLRKKSNEKCTRVMLYVHGGAYFFGSVDEHRYQLQRHARKLRARVFAPRYRLAPQYPFPCGLQDCLAAYLHLLTVQDPTEIILSGDSAGGGMVTSLLVVLRDRGLPLPAGAILISPWVDLTHSFPSVAGDNKFDYIPAHGFMQRPSPSWPPPNVDDMNEISLHAIEKLADAELPRKSTHEEREAARQIAVQGFSVEENPKNIDPKNNESNPASHGASKVENAGNTIPGPGHDLSIMIDNKLVIIKDQIQMYATNHLISHPLVSPVMQPTLGGLPPILILTGGGEVLRDEQIYLAHKMANPGKYPPSEAYLDAHPEARELINKFKPTNVQLQVWDDLCHVAPTLSFTRPAKYMYRSIAQFGAWALAKAQRTEIEILDDDDVSIISTDSDTESEEDVRKQQDQAKDNGVVKGGVKPTEHIGKAGDPLPSFKNHMVRQRVDRHGNIFPLDPASSLPALQLTPDQVGVIKEGPVSKWMKAKSEWDSKYAKEKRKVQKQRIKEIAQGYQSFGTDEVPPPSALAGRRGASMPKEQKTRRSWGMSLWSLWGSSHDEKTMKREEEIDKEPETTVATPTQGKNVESDKRPDIGSRSRSRHRTVTDQGQTDGADEPAALTAKTSPDGSLSPNFIPLIKSPEKQAGSPLNASSPLGLPGTNVTLDSPSAMRPKADGVAFPFKLGKPIGHVHEDNASTMTLDSQRIGTPVPEAAEDKQLGSSALANYVSTVGPEDPTSDMTASSDGVLTKESERPGIERFETAREDQVQTPN